MDSALNDESIRNFFKKSYVIEHLTVDESNDKKYLENPGAAALLTKYHGDRQGIPYWVILDKNGNFLADSRLEANGKTGNSVGCPAKPEEVDYFVNVLHKTSKISDEQISLIKRRFLKIGQ